MIKIFIFYFAFLLSLILGTGCSKAPEKQESQNKTDQKTSQKTDTSIKNNTTQKNVTAKDSLKFAPQSDDDAVSKKIARYLVKEYLKDQIDLMLPKDRNFQMYKIDLNGDGKDEFFIRLLGSHFCGSGGCTFLIVSPIAQLITAFTVTREPIIVNSDKINNWNVLYLESGGAYRKVMFDKGTYPQNPSILPPANYVPTEKDVFVFDDEKNPCKTYSY